jgi:tetratricopeptide (TPR) repeat protein
MERALELNPRFVAGWQRRAIALSALGLHEDALTCWDAAAALAPRNVQVLNGRGWTLLSLQRAAEALAAFEQVIAVDPRFALARLYKANAEEALGRADDAAKTYQIFLSLAPPVLAPQIEHARARLAELRS